MVFNSLEFGLFLSLCLALYWPLPRRAQNRFLLVASYGFYAAWDWRFLGLIWLSTLVDFAVGGRIAETSDERARRRWLTLSLVANLGILGAFKYGGFFSESLAELGLVFGLELPRFFLDVVLPVGISFYTFQSLSYTIDIYRGRLEPVRSLPDFALFVALFPQLVAGPIERARRLLPQIARPRRIDVHAAASGAQLILWGLFKKSVIADNLASVVDAVYAPGATPTGPEVWIATYAFAIQIYCDFSGYTDIARGSARLLGFELMRNFDLPYGAASPREFWRRWHISLSTWLRDYLYFSLGGNRGGAWRTRRNLALTMLLGGLWHGAAWTFVLWGAFHGAWLIAHRALEGALARVAPGGERAARLWHALCVLVTFHGICLGWSLFRAESLALWAERMSALATRPELGLAPQWIVPLAVLSAPLVASGVVSRWWREASDAPGPRWPVRGVVYALLFLGLVVLGEDFGEPFIYFQF